MKLLIPCLAFASLASAAGPELMQQLMARKTEHRIKLRAEGLFDEGRYLGVNKLTPCANGKSGEYSCQNVDMHGFLSHQAMGSRTREGNDVWAVRDDSLIWFITGWTSPDGREFGAIGQTDGTAFVEVLKDGTLKYIARLNTQTSSSIWRDMKVIDGYCYIGSEAASHGLQVFDMRKLLTTSQVKTFSSADLTAHLAAFGSSHNIVAHEEKKMIYAVGTTRTNSCRGGLFMVDVSNPASPRDVGCASQDGYVHDAQCVVYTGPDTKYKGKEICFNYNEDTLTIMDLTSKSAPRVISKTPYTGARYTHQGWLADENMSYLLLDDELDEQQSTNPGIKGRTTTYIFDIRSLERPVNTGYYQSPVKAADHNMYVLNGHAYQANYASGLRIVDVSSVARDPTGKSFKQTGFFDTHPQDDAAGGSTAFSGVWSVYPYFKSGYILLNSIERGAFSLKYTGPQAGKA
ncbi:hypothetical protein FQN57_001066 [Myotisia sp. PD_48]|nr:hypothetical protein FQN57_001066 [Myotisia sp. PD_48]